MTIFWHTGVHQKVRFSPIFTSGTPQDPGGETAPWLRYPPDPSPPEPAQPSPAQLLGPGSHLDALNGAFKMEPKAGH